MWAEFSKFQVSPLRSKIYSSAFSKSILTRSQQALKKLPMKPSGPGAFSPCKDQMVALISSIVTWQSRCWSCYVGSSRKLSFRQKCRDCLLPRRPLKCSRRIFSSSLCSDFGPSCPNRVGIWFFCLLPLALRWKSFVLASFTLIPSNLDFCLHLDLSIAANPRSLDFREALRFLSSVERALSSWATSSWKITSFAMPSCNLLAFLYSLSHFLRAMAVLDNFVCSTLMASWELTCLFQARETT